VVTAAMVDPRGRTCTTRVPPTVTAVAVLVFFVLVYSPQGPPVAPGYRTPVLWSTLHCPSSVPRSMLASPSSQFTIPKTSWLHRQSGSSASVPTGPTADLTAVQHGDDAPARYGSMVASSSRSRPENSSMVHTDLVFAVGGGGIAE